MNIKIRENKAKSKHSENKGKQKTIMNKWKSRTRVNIFDIDMHNEYSNVKEKPTHTHTKSSFITKSGTLTKHKLNSYDGSR